MFASVFAVLALSTSAYANVYVTSPVASTTFVGGQQSTVSWQDDGTTPSLASFGPAIVSIYAGNSQQQTLLQTITPSVDVSTTQSIVFTPDPSIGPDANEYFIRFQSIGLMEGQYPAMAFSAKFTMSGMSGTFNATVSSEIDGQSTAPIGGTAPPAAGSTPAAAPSLPAATTSGLVTTTSKSAAATSAAKTTSAAGAASTNGSARLAGAGIAAFAGIAVAIMGATFL